MIDAPMEKEQPAVPLDAPGVTGDLATHKREFIETFFKRGAEFAEELMRENEKLRFRIFQLEEQRLAEGGATLDRAAPASSSGESPIADLSALRTRLQQLEREREDLVRRFQGVERLNHDYGSRYQEIERENNSLANLYVASHQLHSTLDLREVTQIITEILLNFIGAKTFAIQLVDEERAVLRTLAAEGVDRRNVPERRVDLAATDAVADVLRNGRPRYAEGALTPRAITGPPAVTVPLKIGDRVVGLILVWELLAQKTGLVDVDFELFNLLGDHAGAALQSAKLHTDLEGRPPALWAAADLV